jgi:hypothetical protein
MIDEWLPSPGNGDHAARFVRCRNLLRPYGLNPVLLPHIFILRRYFLPSVAASPGSLVLPRPGP